MQKLLAGTGIAFCAIGLMLGTMAIIAHFSPPDDPTGAAASYDKSVDAYNDRVNEIVESSPGLAAMPKGKTFLQAHREDTLFWIVVAGVVAFAGIALCLTSRSRKIAART